VYCLDLVHIQHCMCKYIYCLSSCHTHVYNRSINIRIFKKLFYWIITLDLDSVLIITVRNIYAVKNTLFCPIKLLKFGHILSMCLYQTGRVRGHGYEVSSLLVSTISRLPFRTVPTAMVFFLLLVLFLLSYFLFSWYYFLYMSFKGINFFAIFYDWMLSLYFFLYHPLILEDQRVSNEH